METVAASITDDVEVGQLHRTNRFDNHRGFPADRFQPAADLVGVRHRCRQADEGDVVGKVQDHLFPDGAAKGVLEVVDLVEHHHVEVGEVVALVEHVAQDFGGHHHHIGIAVDGVVAGEQPHTRCPDPRAEVSVFLVAQSLDGRGVESAPSSAERQVDRVIGDDVLPLPVGADTSTDRPSSTCPIASSW